MKVDVHVGWSAVDGKSGPRVIFPLSLGYTFTHTTRALFSLEIKPQKIFQQPASKTTPTNTTPNPAKRTMCQQTRATIHACGHPRTRGLFERCSEAWRTRIPCMEPDSVIRMKSFCYDCEEVEMHSPRRTLPPSGCPRATESQRARFRASLRLSDAIVLPETSEVGAAKSRAGFDDIWGPLRLSSFEMEKSATVPKVEVKELKKKVDGEKK
ncbi:hypothetical protein Q7P37_003572 [Cladosporium fusiforme]